MVPATPKELQILALLLESVLVQREVDFAGDKIGEDFLKRDTGKEVQCGHLGSRECMWVF